MRDFSGSLRRRCAGAQAVNSARVRSPADKAFRQVELGPDDLSPPRSLRLPRLRFAVSSSPGLKKTTANFLALLTDERKLVSKRPPNPPLRYVETPVFRIESDFIAQTGDITRRDGSGGESICAFTCVGALRERRLTLRRADGGSFNDEKEGLKIAFQKGTLAMANSGKNCERAQLGCLRYPAVRLTPVPACSQHISGKSRPLTPLTCREHPTGWLTVLRTFYSSLSR